MKILSISLKFSTVYYKNNYLPCNPLLKRFFLHKVMASTETFPHELNQSVVTSPDGIRAGFFRRPFSGVGEQRGMSEFQARVKCVMHFVQTFT